MAKLLIETSTRAGSLLCFGCQLCSPEPGTTGFCHAFSRDMVNDEWGRPVRFQECLAAEAELADLKKKYEWAKALLFGEQSELATTAKSAAGGHERASRGDK